MISANNPPALPSSKQFNPEATKQKGADAYTFNAEPRGIQQRKKFRDEAENTKGP